MTAKEKVDAIKDLLETGLPSLLTAYSPSLSDFEDYLDRAPTDSEKRQIGVYIRIDDDNTIESVFGVIIQAQIYGERLTQEYHSVIKPFLLENLTGSVVGMTERDELASTLWPIDINRSTGFILYEVIFKTQLDSCDY